MDATPLVSAAREARTLFYRALSPIDWIQRRARGRGHLPPLWLRRHVGPVGQFEDAARAMAETISGLVQLTPTDQTLDLGCGCGAMVPFFAAALGEQGRYLGLDVHPPSIQWCRKQFGGDPRLRFELVPVRSPYGDGRGALEEYRFPLPDGSADFVLAKSLFTHLLEPEARHYLAEIRRVLRPGREALVTAFLFDGSGAPAFPFPSPEAPVRWRRRSHPHAAVAFERRFFESMIGEAGLEVRRRLPAVPAGQDVLLLTRLKLGQRVEVAVHLKN